MILKRTKLSKLYVSLSFLILSAVLFSSCESSRVGPSVPTPNPPPPTQQALILNGFVKDASSQAVISGASIKITKTDGTLVTTLLTDDGGKYSFDATNVAVATLNVSASKDGYAFSTVVAKIDKTSNSASVASILLAKLTVTTYGITAASGGTGSATNTQSVSGQSLGVNVPAGAVPSNIQLTVSAIPAGQVPQPSDPNVSVVSVGQFGPTGTQFSKPVTITFPLPYAMTPGKVFQLMQLNEQTGAFTNSGFTATVNADGTSADAQVTHFTTYTLQTPAGEITINVGNPSSSDGSNQIYANNDGSSTSIQLSVNNSIGGSVTGSVSLNFVKDKVGDKISLTEGSSTQLISFNGNGLDSKYIVNGVQVGPNNNANEKGNWEYRWYYALRTTNETGTASGPGWSANVTVTTQEWVIKSSGWYWISHDQGGTVQGPF